MGATSLVTVGEAEIEIVGNMPTAMLAQSSGTRPAPELPTEGPVYTAEAFVPREPWADPVTSEPDRYGEDTGNAPRPKPEFFARLRGLPLFRQLLPPVT